MKMKTADGKEYEGTPEELNAFIGLRYREFPRQKLKKNGGSLEAIKSRNEDRLAKQRAYQKKYWLKRKNQIRTGRGWVSKLQRRKQAAIDALGMPLAKYLESLPSITKNWLDELQVQLNVKFPNSWSRHKINQAIRSEERRRKKMIPQDTVMPDIETFGLNDPAAQETEPNKEREGI